MKIPQIAIFVQLCFAFIQSWYSINCDHDLDHVDMAKVSCPHTIPNAEEARVEPDEEEEMDEDSRSLARLL